MDCVLIRLWRFPCPFQRRTAERYKGAAIPVLTLPCQDGTDSSNPLSSSGESSANRAASAFRRERPARRSARWPGRSLCSRRLSLRGRELSRADAKTDAGEKLHPGELVLESEPLRDGKRPPLVPGRSQPGYAACAAGKCCSQTRIRTAAPSWSLYQCHVRLTVPATSDCQFGSPRKASASAEMVLSGLLVPVSPFSLLDVRRRPRVSRRW